jgi:integration host factor subunit alpha
MKKTITRAELADALHDEMGFSHADSCKLLDQVLQTMIAALANGESVKISKFASFIPRKKTQRMGRNPRTGDKHVITPRRVLSFKASNLLKRALKAQG